ncbi:MAG TPA: dTDP-4-dehydrorhamnose reductase [Gammaproteobacteria bacterium]|nr:dTDP-4-dehydrorhamnose reductase [Gammaproteobacteria bacterium]
MKILLAGANGQVGREVGALMPQAIALAKSDLDITQLNSVEQSLNHYMPDFVINAAGYTAVDKAEQEPKQAFAINRDGIFNLAVCCKKLNIPLLHLSTDYVFNGAKASPYLEEDEIEPINIYGASKAEGEKVLQKTWEKHIILRVSWVFGQYGHNFVKTVLRLAAEKKELRIVSDQIGCPTPAFDIAKTLALIIEKIQQGHRHWGMYHYCGDSAVSWFEFAKTILSDQSEIKIQPILSVDYPTPAKRPKNSVMNAGKIKQTFGIQPANWRASLKELLRTI